MSNVVKIEGLAKHYDGFNLKNIDLVVPRGTVVGFIGSNGAGKTTTLKSLLGATLPDAGTIDLFGQRIFDKSVQSGFDDAEMVGLKERTGVVLDSCSLPEELKVKDAEAILRSSYARWESDQFRQYLAQFKLDEKKRIKELSRGMSMKLSLACALSHHAELLVLDEPTAGLDPLAREEMIQVFQQFMEDENHSILMSSHITSDLEKLADYIVCIDEGRIVFSIEKDLITDEVGVAHCRESEFDAVIADGFFLPGEARYLRQGTGISLLVPDRFAFQRAYADIAVDKARIDNYMNLVLKGEKR